MRLKTIIIVLSLTGCAKTKDHDNTGYKASCYSYRNSSSIALGDIGCFEETSTAKIVASKKKQSTVTEKPNTPPTKKKNQPSEAVVKPAKKSPSKTVGTSEKVIPDPAVSKATSKNEKGLVSPEKQGVPVKEKTDIFTAKSRYTLDSNSTITALTFDKKNNVVFAIKRSYKKMNQWFHGAKLMKLSSAESDGNNVLWETDIDGNAVAYIKNIRILPDNSIVATWNSRHRDGNYAIHVGKFSENGEKIWQRDLFSKHAVKVNSLAVSHEIVIAGIFHKTFSIPFEGQIKELTTAFVFDSFVIQFSKDGLEVVEASILNKNTETYSTRLSTHQDSEILLVGAQARFFDTNQKSSFDSNATDGFVIALDEDHAVAQKLFFSNDSVVSIAGVSKGFSNDEFFVLGYFQNTLEMDAFNTVTSSGYGDVFVAKYSADFELLWVKTLGGSENDVPNSLHVDAEHLYVTGFFGDTLLLTTFEKDGNQLWSKELGNQELGFENILAVSKKRIALAATNTQIRTLFEDDLSPNDSQSLVIFEVSQ